MILNNILNDVEIQANRMPLWHKHIYVSFYVIMYAHTKIKKELKIAVITNYSVHA